MAESFEQTLRRYEEERHMNFIKQGKKFEEELNNLDIKVEKIEVTKISYPVLINKEYVEENRLLTPYVLANAYFEDEELIFSPKQSIEKDLEIIKLKQRIKELESEDKQND
ncbi:hypothetical protein BJG88_10335 [Staphylococcus nepalensis]|uniref:hypothetical protein n=1 Tax=Staphylococcus nepalensis TaxID=214473 RepID=UPI000D589778|nr:hypothetical protein [Staphylococcus nepalensis]AWI45110.1 hypothetical protein BJG88_10335 [Staphylococcus nepalensis]